MRDKFKHCLKVLFFITYYCSGLFAQFKFNSKTQRILFLGNSITYAGHYLTDIETYYKVKYPKLNFEFINVGLPSETVSGLSEVGHADGRFPRPALQERLNRVLDIIKPDLVFACYGMNDGIYLPLQIERFNKFKEGINWLHDAVIATGAKIIHLTPPVYDEKRGNAKDYAEVLEIYSDWLITNKVKNWNVIDIHYPMKKYLQNQRKTDKSYAMAADGIHINEVGHWLIAKNILNYLGEKNLLRAGNVFESLKNYKYALQINKLIMKRQKLMKDAWLTKIGHNRPEMDLGKPFEEAQKIYNDIAIEINSIYKQK